MPTVLIVDDEQHIRLLIEQTLEDLEDEGLDLQTASDGEMALDVVRNHHPELVFLDVMVPKLDGFEVCRAIKQDLGLADTGMGHPGGGPGAGVSRRLPNPETRSPTSRGERASGCRSREIVAEHGGRCGSRATWGTARHSRSPETRSPDPPPRLAPNVRPGAPHRSNAPVRRGSVTNASWTLLISTVAASWSNIHEGSVLISLPTGALRLSGAMLQRIGW